LLHKAEYEKAPEDHDYRILLFQFSHIISVIHKLINTIKLLYRTTHNQTLQAYVVNTNKILICDRLNKSM